MSYIRGKSLTMRRGYGRLGEEEFRCLNCQQFVSCAPGIGAVQNRNHCPACLWSRHLDWRVGGDRLSDCRAGMRPIGLTTKHSRNKYAGVHQGELMLIHQCDGCDALSINRVAGDDSASALYEVFEGSLLLDQRIMNQISAAGIMLLSSKQRELAEARLFGIGHDCQLLIEEA